MKLRKLRQKQQRHLFTPEAAPPKHVRPTIFEDRLNDTPRLKPVGRSDRLWAAKAEAEASKDEDTYMELLRKMESDWMSGSPEPVKGHPFRPFQVTPAKKKQRDARPRRVEEMRVPPTPSPSPVRESERVMRHPDGFAPPLGQKRKRPLDMDDNKENSKDGEDESDHGYMWTPGHLKRVRTANFPSTPKRATLGVSGMKQTPQQQPLQLPTPPPGTPLSQKKALPTPETTPDATPHHPPREEGNHRLASKTSKRKRNTCTDDLPPTHSRPKRAKMASSKPP